MIDNTQAVKSECSNNPLPLTHFNHVMRRQYIESDRADKEYDKAIWIVLRIRSELVERISVEYKREENHRPMV